MVKQALELQCPTCQAHQPGNARIPNTSLTVMPCPWEFVGMDVFEVHVRSTGEKIKVLLVMDLATHFKIMSLLHRYPADESRSETTEQVIEALTRDWLQGRPRPK